MIDAGINIVSERVLVGKGKALVGNCSATRSGSEREPDPKLQRGKRVVPI